MCEFTNLELPSRHGYSLDSDLTPTWTWLKGHTCTFSYMLPGGACSRLQVINVGFYIYPQNEWHMKVTVFPLVSFLFVCSFFLFVFFFFSTWRVSSLPYTLLFPPSSLSLCLQHNLFSTEDIFNSLLRLASNRSGGVGDGWARKRRRERGR